jgi:hypothetical protein
MMRRCIPSLLVVLCLGAPAHALPTHPTLAGDARLSAAVTLQSPKAPLSDILRQLGEKVGVKITASAEVADDPAILFAKERPAREVLTELAALFTFTWRRSGREGAYSYELFQDLKSRRAEEALRVGEAGLAIEGIRRGIQQRLALASKPPAVLLQTAERYDAAARERRLDALPRGPEYDLMRAEKSSWPIRELASDYWRMLLRLAASLTPEQWASLLTGDPLWLGTSPGPGIAPLPQVFVRAVRETPPSSIFPPGAVTTFRTEDERASHEQRGERLRDQWRQTESHRIGIRLEVTQKEVTTAKLLVRVSTLRPRSFAGGELMTPPSLEIKSESPARVEVAEPVKQVTDPVLLQERPWERSSRVSGATDQTYEWMNEELIRIAKTYEIDLIADAYRHPGYAAEPLNGRTQPLWRVLDALLKRPSRWARSGSFVVVRRKLWFLDRAAEVAETVSGRWEAYLRKNRAFEPRAVVRVLAELRDEQLPNFVGTMADRGIRIESFHLGTPGSELRRFLRTLGMLSDSQWRVMRAGGDLRVATLPPPLRAQVRSVMAERHWGGLEPPADDSAAIIRSPRVIAEAAHGERDSTVLLYTDTNPRRELGGTTYPAGSILPPLGAVHERFFVYKLGSREDYFYLNPPPVTVRPVPPTKPSPPK